MKDNYETHDYGTCCACGKPLPNDQVNILLLPRHAPVPGTGWGCYICGLPPDGATAILCSNCLSTGAQPKWVVKGLLLDKRRAPIESLDPVPFDHRKEPHEQDPVTAEWWITDNMPNGPTDQL